MKKMRRKRSMIAAILAAVMVVSGMAGMGMTARADTCGGLEPEDVYAPSEEEVIKDPILHWAIRAAMNSIQGSIKLTADVVGDKSVKNISYELCAHPEDFETEAWEGKQFWIESLEGIQYAKSATMVDIAYTSAVEGKSLADLSPLSELTQLQELILKQDGINDITALSTLTNLTLLDLSVNREITDISSVKDMKKLKRMNVSYNKITSVDAIAELENLEYVDISQNQIASLPDMSKLKKVYFLDASHNKLTDVSAIAGMTELQELNLAGNSGITDLTPLAGLLKLDKDKTVLPDESKKEDLFAAIEVNKLFSLFNISKMQTSDLTNVQKALDAYDALSTEQKTYIDENRVEAARSNKQKVENGGEPEYYPEYDIDGERQPIWNRLEIKVVDKKGVPIADAEFTKTSRNAFSETSKTVKTDSFGQLTLTHTATDAMYDEIEIAPAGDIYVAEPAAITYSVNWGNTTATVNGNLATGLENLKFVLIPKDEYVDKSGLQELLENAEQITEAYKYTEGSYQNLEEAVNRARVVYEDADASKEDVDAAVSGLNEAMSGLEKTDILTELKLIVKDENGNLFTRPFKFQIRVPETGAEAWNQLSDPYTGIAYLQASPGWEDGKTWEVLACHEEPYDVEPFLVTIGVKDGKRYYKTVDGSPVDVDYEKVVTVKLRADGAPDKTNERKPDSTVLEEYIEAAKQYKSGSYTPGSYSVLTTAVSDAENTVADDNATQNDYNAAAAAIKQAEAGLTKLANKSELQKEVNMQYSYSQENYTAESWAEYQSRLTEAEEVLEDGNATQQEVDDACAALLQARNRLVVKVNKSVLESKLTEARALNADDYQSGFEELQQVIAEAQAVYDDEAATQNQVDVQVEALENAISALVKKPAEVDYSCQAGRFRAKIVDEEGNPVSGVAFKAWIGETVDEEVPLTSDANGVITYYVYGPLQYGYTTYIRLDDSRYTTEDVHCFTVTNSSYMASIATVDDQPFVDGIKLTYVIHPAGGGSEPEAVDKKELDDQIFFASSYEGKADDYTAESYEAFSNALAEARRVYHDENATQEQVNEAANNLKAAREGLIEIEKPALCDKYTIRIQVVDSDGNKLTDRIPFTIALDGYKRTQYSYNGVIEYAMSTADYGTQKITVAPQDETIIIGEKEYTADPAWHEFAVQSTSSDVIIVEIDGEALSGTKEVRFVLKEIEEEPDPEPEDNNWVQGAGGWWYRNPDGSYPYSCWKKIDGNWYYFNAKGYRVTGWKSIRNVWYYFDPATGIMCADQWITDTYYVKSNGAMATGWLKLDEGWYYLNSSGARVTGWVKSKNIWYYMDPATGIMCTDQWIEDTYYVKGSGAMATGWLELGGNWYYLKSSGAKLTGWVQSRNIWYYMDPATEIMCIDQWIGDTYYVKNSGAMATGWLLIGDNYYYFGTNGKKVVSQWVGNYYLGADGVMARDQWIGPYYVDANGKWDPSKAAETIEE